MELIDLIPEGRENAIGRKYLVKKCVHYGLVPGNIKDTDRAVRILIENARREHTILNLSDGKGYFRPTKDDVGCLRAYINQEDRRARQTFASVTVAKKLYADYTADRL